MSRRHAASTPHTSTIAAKRTSAVSTIPTDTGLSYSQVLLHGIGITLVALLITVLGIGLGLGWWVHQQTLVFTQEAQVSLPQLKQQLKQGWETPVTHHQGSVTFLILGLDTLAQRGNVPPLTDTVLLATLNLGQNRVTLLPLPRDLWSDRYQTKINALYAYGRTRNPDQPSAFSSQVITEMTGVPIQHTMTVTLDQVAELIDTLGGINVDVVTGFVDEQFPRTDVDVTVERDPAKLYERIEFVAGPQTMDGATALKYIRSRHSVGDEGDDIARARRQQQVIQALITRLTTPSVMLNPTRLGKLYAFYQHHYQDQLPLTQLIAILKTIADQRTIPELASQQLSIFPDDANGVITHPPASPKQQLQWVYVVRDQQLFAEFVKQKLGISQPEKAR